MIANDETALHVELKNLVNKDVISLSMSMLQLFQYPNPFFTVQSSIIK